MARRSSLASKTENPQSPSDPNTTKKRQGPSTSKTPRSHSKKTMQEKELMKNLETELRERAYAFRRFEEAVDCLLLKQRDEYESHTDPEYSLQSWSLDKKDDRITGHTTADFSFLTFEPILSTLKINLEDTASEKDLDAMPENDRIARWTTAQEHLVDVFHWLRGIGEYECTGKNVKGIMRLVIRDRSPYFCSDETMTQCLEGLEVRYLDWNRPNVCTKTLLLIPDLVSVNLYWTGLQAVLCSWDDANGLRQLKKLRDVTLYAEKGQESIKTMESYVDSFIQGAQDWQRTEGTRKFPLIQPEYPNSIRSGKKKRMDQESGASKSQYHPWFEKTTEFANYLQTMGRKGAKIKVAVIDDGVSPTYERVGKYLHHPGWPFKGVRAQENFASTNQHGSRMAYLITKICPHSEIYVAKLDASTSNSLRQRTFCLEAAKKIGYRLGQSQEVDIISMSWNVRRSQNKGKNDTGNEDAVNKLQQSINTAATNKGILMYCAAGDNMAGTGKDQEWVPCDLENTHSIGATDIHGNKKPYVIDNGKLEYLFPGECLLPKDDHDVKEVGNSGATALAAGLAAMVLYFVRAQGIYINRGPAARTYVNKVFNTVFNASGAHKVVQVANVLEEADLERLKEKLKAET